MTWDASVHGQAIALVKLCLQMTTAAESGHPTSGASLAHLVTILMYRHMRYDRARPDDPAADRLVLSEGHACPIIYAAAADLGIAIGRDSEHRRPMTIQDAMQLRAIDSSIDGHPNPAEGFPFFPAATGSLGQGLSVAAGIALAARLDGLDKRVFCLIGDGESREGQIAEALDMLIDHRLTAVCPIFNCNGYGQAAHVSRQQSPEVLSAKVRATGYDVREIDGHDPWQIQAALDDHTAHAQDPNGRMFAIVARTVKGWGFQHTVGENAHGRAVPRDKLSQALAELDETARRLGVEGELGRGMRDGAFRGLPPADFKSPLRNPQSPIPSFHEALKQFGQDKLLAKGTLAPRKAFGIALRALGRADPRIVALDGDVENSTFTEFFDDDPALHPRFFECKIAEQNMMSCGAGLASGGKIPFVATFGKFLTRAYDQLDMALISRLPMKLVGSHVGTSLAADGPSQMALADIGFFHAWATVRNRHGEPMMYILNPADAYSAYALTIAMAQHDGACYLRAMRPDVPLLYDEETTFSLGGHYVLRRGSDLLIAATGYMVHQAIAAAERLAQEGIDATLVDLYSLPLDAEALADLARQHHGRLLTLEDNYGSGIGAAVSGALAAHGVGCTVKQMFVRQIPKSGRTPEDLDRYLGLSVDDVVRTAEEVAGRKRQPVGARG